MVILTDTAATLQSNEQSYHLGIKKGQISQRCILVGSFSRADIISTCLDEIILSHTSDRLFRTYTGLYNNSLVSIIAIGMGAAMMDFFVREADLICNKSMAIIRLGTCGLLKSNLNVGSIQVPINGCYYIYSDYSQFDPFNEKNTIEYKYSRPIMGDEELTNLLLNEIKACGLEYNNCLNASSEMFYSTQARNIKNFDDGNNLNIDFKNADSCEMETYLLYYLSKIKKNNLLRVSAAHIGVVNRTTNSIPNINHKQLAEIERKLGICALNAIIKINLTH